MVPKAREPGEPGAFMRAGRAWRLTCFERTTLTCFTTTSSALQHSRNSSMTEEHHPGVPSRRTEAIQPREGNTSGSADSPVQELQGGSHSNADLMTRKEMVLRFEELNKRLDGMSSSNRTASGSHSRKAEQKEQESFKAELVEALKPVYMLLQLIVLDIRIADGLLGAVCLSGCLGEHLDCSARHPLSRSHPSSRPAGLAVHVTTSPTNSVIRYACTAEDNACQLLVGLPFILLMACVSAPLGMALLIALATLFRLARMCVRVTTRYGRKVWRDARATKTESER